MRHPGRVLLATLVTVGVPAALGAVWRDLITAHPVPALLLAAGYEVVLLIGVLLVKAIMPVLDRRLRQGGEAVDRRLGQAITRYGQRYRERVAASLKLIDTKGLATGGPFLPELDEVFVDVGLTTQPLHRTVSGVLADIREDSAKRHSIHDLIDQIRPAVLAVIGAPGSGKTTLLRQVARRAARAGRGRRRGLPILLLLRDHVLGIVGRADRQYDLPQILRATVHGLRVVEPDGWWEEQLHQGRCLVLLDGLDEVARAEDRRAVAAWIEHQIRLYPGNDFVITSRPHGYQSATVEQAVVLQARPFTDTQVRQFLHAWYLATMRHATNSPDPDVRLRAAEAAEDLLARLAAAPVLYGLTVNPLLLTMIANVHRYRGALPGSRADLYGEICQVMLWRRQEAKKLVTIVPGAGKERLLGRLAFSMMTARVRDMRREDVLEIVRPALRRVSKAVTAEDFLTDVSSNGLLVEREKDLFAFAHHTFGEYLAAKHIRDTGQVGILVEGVSDPWWRETTLLYVAGADADQIVAACLDVRTVNALALAFECVHIECELAEELEGQLEQVLAEAFDSGASQETRRLIAGVLATRHVGAAVATTTGSHVVPSPVTEDLYWLFVRETRAPRPDVFPEFRPSNDFPAMGIWRQELEQFIEWLNGVLAEAGAQPVRLPTDAELGAAVVRGALRLETFVAGSPLVAWVRSEITAKPAWLHLAVDADRHSLVTPALVEIEVASPLAADVGNAGIVGQLTAVAELAGQAAVQGLGDLGEAQAREWRLVRRELERIPGNEVLQNPLRPLDPERSLDPVTKDLCLTDQLTGRTREPGGMARALAHALVRDVRRFHEADRQRGWLSRSADKAVPLLDVWELVMGRTFALALDAALAQNDDPVGEVAGRAFVGEIVRRAFGGSSAVLVDLSMVAAAAIRISRIVDSRSVPMDGWRTFAALRLAALAKPVFDRSTELTPELARRIRLLAVGLAPELDGGQLATTVRHDCQLIAAGVSAMEARSRGDAPMEVVFLARA